MIQKKYLILLSLTGLLVTLDQMVKIYVHTSFGLGESITVINNFFNLTYVRNPGAAFGIFRDAHEAFRTIFFLSMPPIAMTIIFFMLKGVDPKDTPQIVALSSIFGEALGNYIDRLRFGYVIDFLDFHYKQIYNYPAFNIADMAIVCGVGFLLILMLKGEAKPASSDS